MIKLKSLFRRGQGASSSSSSSKHSSNHGKSSSSTKSESTNSLDRIDPAAPDPNTVKTKFYPSQSPRFDIDIQNRRKTKTPEFVATERGIDVGSDGIDTASTALLAPPSNVSGEESVSVDNLNNFTSASTLPLKNKATKATKAANKRQRQPPKQLSSTTNVTNAEQQHSQAIAATKTTTTTTNQLKASSANVMTTIACTPGSINSAGKSVTADKSSTTAANNNNINNNNNSNHGRHGHHFDNSPSSAANSPVGITDNVMSSEIIRLNSTPVDEQQQQQQLKETAVKMQELQEQLDRLERENLILQTKINELMPYQNETGQLKHELLKMQSLHDKNNLEITNLKYENESLRNRLRDVVNSSLSDAEKHQIIQDSQRLHSSAPASIALPSSSEQDGTPCVTPDWDKNSSSSEISVACLQDKIIQMEETHYSTNEELQATLQELADLQTQLSETQTENERLSEEKDVLFQSLCRQTEKLNESRTQINTLQDLLLRDAKQAEIGTSEREKKLLDLIKTSQEEREAILLKQEELNSELQELRQNLETSGQENGRLRERLSLLDCTVDAANAERKQIESALLLAKEETSQQAIEIKRLTTLLDNARSKVEELEQDLARGDKTDLSDVLDAARKEKDALEERAAALQDQCSRSQAEIKKLKDQLSATAEECKVAKNNAKCAISHLEYLNETQRQEKEKVFADYQQLLESTAELQVQCKCHLEDKAQLQNLLTETQKHVGDLERKLMEKEERLDKEIQLRKQEADEWQQFQSDLLMTVRVANDFKTEALSAREQLVIDNKTQKEKIRLLEQQIEKLTKQQIQQNETQQSVLSTVQQEMASRRSKITSLTKQDSRLSVKSLIETIENNKQPKTEEIESHYSSSSSLNSGTPDNTTPNILPVTANIPNEWTNNVRIPGGTLSSLTTKGPLREQQQQQSQPQSVVSNNYFPSINNVSKSFLSGERKDPLNMLAKNGGSKRNALLKWCQNKTVGYRNIDITNFSSSWNDGLAFCAILHSYLPDLIPYDTLSPANKRRNFSLAFSAAESVGIPTTLNISDMCQIERPDWTQVMSYVTAIYKHFET